MRPPLVPSALLALLFGPSAIAAGASQPQPQGLATPIHEAGRCAMRGQCAKTWTGDSLPCVDNGRAAGLGEAARERLVSLCGPTWAQGNVCCDEEQVSRWR